MSKEDLNCEQMLHGFELLYGTMTAREKDAFRAGYISGMMYLIDKIQFIQLKKKEAKK